VADLRGGFVGFLQAQQQSVLRDEQIAEMERRRKAQLADFQERAKIEATIRETAAEKGEARLRERRGVGFERQKEITTLRGQQRREERVLSRKEDAESRFAVTEALLPGKLFPFVQNDFSGKLQSLVDDTQFKGQIGDFDSFKVAALALKNSDALADGGFVAGKAANTLQRRAERFMSNLSSIDPQIRKDRGLPEPADVAGPDFTIDTLVQFEETVENLSSIQRGLIRREETQELVAINLLQELSRVDPEFNVSGLTAEQRTNPVFIQGLINDAQRERVTGERVSIKELAAQEKLELEQKDEELDNEERDLRGKRRDLERELKKIPPTLTDKERTEKEAELIETNNRLNQIPTSRKEDKTEIRSKFSTRRRAQRVASQPRVAGTPDTTVTGRRIDGVIADGQNVAMANISSGIRRILAAKSSEKRTASLQNAIKRVEQLFKDKKIGTRERDELLAMINSGLGETE